MHSFGYFAFLVARAAGRLRDVTRLIVIDGWFPHDKQWGSVTCAVDVPAGVACTFFFPTFGDRSEYALEAVVRQAMVTRRDITVVRRNLRRRDGREQSASGPLFRFIHENDRGGAAPGLVRR